MHSVGRSLRVARALALGSTLSGIAACETRAPRDDQPVDFRSNSGGASSADASAAVAPSSAVAPDAGVGATASVVEGASCSPQEARGELLTGAGILSCRCVATHSGSLVWDCDRSSLVIEGPLPPPELDARA
jgi:hypothetical protein